MPDTPIDLSEGIQSVRLKVPTAEVPIPPEGFAQLHSPAPGELALRLPDGSVVAIGGGGSATTLENERGLVTVEQVGEQDFAIVLYPKPESSGKIQLAGQLFGATGQPLVWLQVFGPFVADRDAILSLSVSPFGLLPSPGAGRFWWVSRVVASYHYGGGVDMAFTGGSTPSVGYPGRDLLSLPGSLLGQTDDALALVLAADTDVFDPTLALDQPLLLKDAIPYADGDPDSVLTLWVQAAVVDVAGA